MIKTRLLNGLIQKHYITLHYIKIYITFESVCDCLNLVLSSGLCINTGSFYKSS